MEWRWNKDQDKSQERKASSLCPCSEGCSRVRRNKSRWGRQAWTRRGLGLVRTNPSPDKSSQVRQIPTSKGQRRAQSGVQARVVRIARRKREGEPSLVHGSTSSNSTRETMGRKQSRANTRAYEHARTDSGNESAGTHAREPKARRATPAT
jgi:hypothetical protein